MNFNNKPTGPTYNALTFPPQLEIIEAQSNVEEKLPNAQEFRKMPRRRLLISSYSDDDDDSDEHQQNQQQQEPEIDVHCQQDPAIGVQPSNPNVPQPVPISDEEFIDVSDSLTPPSPPPEMVSDQHSQQPPPVPPANSGGCPIGDFLLRMGLKLKREWLDSCLRELEGSVRNLDVAAKAKLCFQSFLLSDMNYSGGGVLPPNVDSMHLIDLAGPFVLQVDEIVNISCPLKGRYHNAPSGIKRCLKLSMTDGIQRVFGMEYRPIKDLEVLAPAGLKVVICNVHIRHGLMMLVPEALEVLGGMVDELEAARQRLVAEVNKPPRGKRSRTGTVPPLAARATLAAWPPNDVDVPRNDVDVPRSTSRSDDVLAHTNSSATVLSHSNSSVGHTNTSVHVHGHTDSFVNVHGCTNSSTVHDSTCSSTALGSTNSSTVHGSTSRSTILDSSNVHGSTSRSTILDSSNVHGCTNSSISRRAALFQANDQDANVVAPVHGTNQSSMEEFAPPMSSENLLRNPSSVVSDVEEMHIDALFDRENIISDQHSNAISNHEDVHMVDEFEHPLILSGEREIPFTYLASLSVKWVAMKEKRSYVQGKVKCFLTGVKGFQYKRRTKYELLVYVDDGSLISEILIDHSVVQKGIGHSPEEVTAALSSSDAKRVGEMKETMRKFQFFLVNFEGSMLVEINHTSPLPVALEMNQGCSASDAWLLIRRLKSSVSAQMPQQPSSDPIDISP